ncbi:MAG: DUF2336 domain-containing protein [Alphaproteobacteria bacterium]|nr:DUF2336 domain-containing protein [Alphaproteobacteria bacterium]MDE2111533.1 DUF2336 domain-containing protein [Alphaproteobacteria bacterium]MDE2494977.1 DUF2336 domain-containing protein [Alphaproteobacteria bacterium]
MAESARISEQNALTPSEALRLLEQRAQSAQHELASRTDAGPDVLHYLAQNGAVATRRAVAANPAASAKSNRLLADDEEDEIRVELARKIGRLFPGLLLAEKKHLRDLTIETLERLARDEEPRVRAMLAEEIKHLDCVPKQVVKDLAHDSEEIVATPIIEYSPLLSDADLIEIASTAHANAMLAAVARRKGLSDDVSDAVVATRDTRAVTILLGNVDAAIRKKTLDTIVSQAAEIAEWHGPLVLRAELSPRVIRRIASFVSSALIDVLASRHKLDDATRAHLARALTKRRQREEKTEQAPANAARDVDAAKRAGYLDDSFIAAAAEACQRETVVCALAVLAKVDENIVQRVLDSGSAKAVTALAWRAGLSMRIAFKLQNVVMRLKGRDLLPARGGVDFPLTEDEMRWHLGYFGVA